MARDGDEHLISLIGMMGSSTSGGDGEAVNAFRAASRALAKRGLTWRDLAERALRERPAPRPIWQDEKPAKREEPERPRQSAPPPPPPPPPPPRPEPAAKQRRSSFNVPPAIGGVVRVLDDDRRARLVVLEVEGENHVFGPIIAHGGGVRDNILAADGRYATLRVRPPRQEGAMPVAVGCSSL